MLPLLLTAGEAFTDRPLANGVRLLVCFIGFTLALTCLRFAWLASRTRQRYRMLGILSYGCVVATPSITGLSRFGQDVNWLATAVYLLGLVLGIAALAANYTVSPDWINLRHRRAGRGQQS